MGGTIATNGYFATSSFSLQICQICHPKTLDDIFPPLLEPNILLLRCHFSGYGDDTPNSNSCWSCSKGELSEECDYNDGMTEEHSFVVRPLLAVKGEEDWRRTSIFQTRVSCQGRLCTTIIDGGSSLNISSQELVEKLNLPLERHPNPFRVSWVNDTSIPVSCRCLVTFLFGKDFEESIWCEFLPIKVSHILLGRPWLFDRRVQHDGYENTYTLICDGRKKFFVQ